MIQEQKAKAVMSILQLKADRASFGLAKTLSAERQLRDEVEQLRSALGIADQERDLSYLGFAAAGHRKWLQAQLERETQALARARAARLKAQRSYGKAAARSEVFGRISGILPHDVGD